ncbi:phospholipase D-like domain-containing protein [Chlamydia suis]|uniref:phospholipase D-like domain-containing protein n=1 Tax=Chlamydia suis TaxID=83559 RepID=UPI0009B04C85|nr:phospholipase D-like domain-containing protein [Chlamydia suis]MEB2689870.1 phospholipase D-like domain-containing protein [Chlamydia suis]
MRIQELGNQLNSYWDCDSSDSDSEESLVDGSRFGACGGITPAPLNDLNSQSISTLAPLTIQNIPVSSSLNPNAQEFVPRMFSTAPTNNPNTAPSLLPIASSCLNIPVTETPSTHNPQTPSTIQRFPGDPGRIQLGFISSFSAHPQPLPHTDPIRMICDTIRFAKDNILIRTYILSSREIKQAIIDKAREGIPVRVEYDNIACLEELSHCPNITLVCRNQNKILLHKKTVLVDGRHVIISTGNFAEKSLRRDINCTLRIDSQPLCSLMAQERAGSCVVGNQTITYYPLRKRFTTDISMITDIIHGAQKKIFLAMNVLSFREILCALEDAHRRGVKVKVIVDSSRKRLAYDMMQRAGCSFPLCASTCFGYLHSKLALVDGRTLIIGSPNWSVSGFNTNYEDLIVVRNLGNFTRRDIERFSSFIRNNSELVTAENVDNRLPPFSEAEDRDSQ